MSRARRRRLFTLAIRDYPDAPPEFADGIDAQLAEVRAWWCAEELGERALAPHVLGEIETQDDIEDAVRAELRTLTAEDIAVVYVTGHGAHGSGGRHYLALPGSRTRGYPTADLITAVLHSGAEHVLVIVNACFAGELHAELAAIRKDLLPHRRKLRSLAVFATADFDERPLVHEFTMMLAEVRDWLCTRAEYAGEWLTFDDFAVELDRARRRLGEHELLEVLQVWRAGPADAPSPCLPNPGYRQPDTAVAAARQQVATSAGELDYWLDRASGRVSATDPGWYFTGRRELTAEVAGFLTAGTGLLLVTGSAGTGKSAIIARAVTLSDPEFLTNPRYTGAVAAAPPSTVPPAGSVAAAVLARNKTTAEVAEQLLTALGGEPVQITDPATHVARLREQLADLLLTRGTSTIVLDGLDEAVDPGLVVVELAGPLLGLTGPAGPLVRLMIGVRSATPGPRPGGPGQELLDVLRRFRERVPVTEVRTDGADTERDIAHYLTALLAERYAAHPAELDGLASLVASRVSPSFLDARFAAQRLRDSATLLTAADPTLRSALNEGTISLLRQDIADTATADYPHETLLAVLRATAFARGGGMPWADIWPAVASAVLDGPVADAAVAYVVGSRLGGYLARDVEDGRVVHRPVHESLAEVLREARSDLGGEVADRGWRVHQRIAKRLRTLLPESPDLAPHPYLRRHLVGHAERGRVLNDDVVPAAFLPWETSGTIRTGLVLPVVDRHDQKVLGAWSRIEPFLGDAPAPARALSLDVARTARRLEPSGVVHPAGLRVRWANWTLIGNVLASTGSTVVAMAAVPLLSGRELVASGDEQGTVRLWDPVSGTEIGTLPGDGERLAALCAVPVSANRTLVVAGAADGGVRLWDPVSGAYESFHAGHAGEVRAMCAVPLPGRVLVATGDEQGTVRLWDPVAGSEVGSLLGQAAGVLALAAVPLRKRTLVAAGDEDGAVRVWSPLENGKSWTMTGHLGAVTALTAARTRLASGGDDGTIRLWDPIRGYALGRPLTGHAGKAVTLAAVVHGKRTLLASSGNDGTIHVWSLDKGVDVPLTKDAVGVTAMVAVHKRGRVLVATGDEQGTVRLWDPRPRTPVPSPGAGGLSAAAVRRPDGTVLLARVGSQGEVWLLDPTTGRPTALPLTGYKGGALSTALVPRPDGSVLLATAAFDGSVRLWDPRTGQPVGSPLRSSVRDSYRPPRVAAVPLPDGEALLATGDEDGTVRLWDPATGDPAGAPLIGHPGWSGAIAALRLAAGRDAIATGDDKGAVRLWDPATGERLGGALIGHTGPVTAAAAVSGGQPLLATGGADGTVRLWDLETGAELTRIVVGSAVNGLAAHSPSGAAPGFLAVVGAAGVALLEVVPSG